MYCKNCGNNIDDNAVICPKCGVATGKNAIAAQDKTNVLAIVGFVFSFLISIVGLICSVIARKQCRESGEKGMGLATAGMVISIAGMVLYVMMVFIILSFAAI